MKSTLAISSVIFTVGLLTIPYVWSDSDFYWGDRGKHKYIDVVAGNPVYKEECGSCHMAYAPGLLPARSWSLVMSGLEEHFGDNAELDAETAHTISQFLMKYSSENTGSRDFIKLNRSIKSASSPVRISDIPYFKHEHDEIPNRMVAGNEQVKSFSQCNACHDKAEQGYFNEHDIRIPGYGRWDD